MLIEFSVENFRSIKDKITLSMVASADKSLDCNLIKNTLKEDNILKTAVLYGANASGKTNVLYAIAFLQYIVLNSHKNQKGNKTNVVPFKLNLKNITKPSKFKIVFIINKIKHIYKLSVNNEKIINESLYFYPEGRRATIFERKNTNNYTFTIDKSVQKAISKRTPENVLYLSRSSQLNYKKTVTVFEWFIKKLRSIGPTDRPEFTRFTVGMLKDKLIKKIILKALLEADVGIDDVSVSFKKLSAKDLSTINLPSKIKDFLIEEIDKTESFTVRTIHTIKKDNKKTNIYFDLSEESEGTQKIFSLIGPWIDALKNGRILVVDELDTKLHPLLNTFLIDLFHDPTQNKGNAQLIFTTHNINLLNLDLFRRDQIWFTEKDSKTLGTNLYSLIEFRPRKDKNIRKGYIVGRYGALPFIQESRIFK